ncbi:hypothetical protein DOTSEDRAFT_75576 [Dothistroma septosporum NZE10]|uniref:Uncharacterized protein n=1 Tax=Dothistroma septosporum (strain NZE10 / CBS 128990) TaxID=675120 RepID=M2Y0S6_DOTSN|nr:hypothetical protein DOTSEDRAFT_75576 [Dothistroma septosporum NZE10]
MSSSGKVSVAEVTKHSSADDCWVVVNGKVYDLSNFAPEHPGGAHMVYKWAGKDGSETYNQFHSSSLIDEQLSDSEKKGPLDESTITQTWKDAQQAEMSTPDKEADPNERPPLASLINLDDFERAFEKSGSKKAWVYIWAGSNDLLSLNANKTWWHKLWFRPRIMKNVSTVNTKMKILGADVSMPVYIAPMGIAKQAGPQGEAALGAGAAGSGIVHCMSTTASMSIEEILASVPPTYPYFFQLYVDRKREKTEAVLAKIEKMDQIRAIFVTVDLAVVSKREADERLIVQETVSVYSNSAKSNIDKKGGGLARNTGGFIDPALNWNDIAWIRKHSSKPIVVKGVQSAADAQIAMDVGCAGIVVSNHGGRALDSSPGTVGILLEIRRDCPQAFEKMEVFIDGGVRRGSDVLKAVMIGARGVGVGRPFQCAVMYDQEGVEHCAAVLQDELETAMRLCGVTDLEKVRGDLSYLNTVELEQMLPPKPRGSWGWWFGRTQSKL